MKEAISSPYPNLVFRETFNDEQTVIKNGGTPNSVLFSNGVGSFNGSSSKINYSLGLNGTYSVRIRCNPVNFSAIGVLLDVRGSNADGTGFFYLDASTGNIITTSGTSYVNGVTSISPTSGVNNEIIITGITLSEGTGSNKSLIGANFGNLFKFLGTMDLFEIYKGTLTASEVANLNNNTWNKEISKENILIDFDSTQGVLKDSTVGNIVLDTYNFNGFITDSWTPRTSGSIDSDNEISGIGAFKTAMNLFPNKRYRIQVIADDYTNLSSIASVSSATYWDDGVISSNFDNFIINTNTIANGGLVLSTTGSFIVNNIIVTEIRPELDVTDVTIKKTGSNYGAEFNGTTSKIDLGTDMIGTKAVTLMGWIKPNTGGETELSRLIDNSQTFIRLNTTSSQRLFQLRSDGSTSANSGSGVLKLNNYNFISATRESDGTVNFYVGYLDTAPVQSGNSDQSSGTPIIGITNVFIGNNSIGSLTFDGKISMLKVVEGILDLQEITQEWSETRKNLS